MSHPAACLNMRNEKEVANRIQEVKPTMTKFPILWWFLILIAVTAAAIMFATSGTARADITRYVREGGTGTGTSWSSASGTIQAMIDAAEDAGGGTVCVSAGNYTPATKVGGTGARYQTFQLRNNVAVYGGFPGSGSPGWAARDWQNNITVLSGEIGNTMTDIDNCYHVFYHPNGTNLNQTAILDGFTIRGGNANIYEAEQDHYYGGGMFNRNSSPQISNCTFSMNSAGDGGGVFNWNCHPTFISCDFKINSAKWGGGIYNYLHSPIFTGCTFSANTANKNGGGMYNDYSAPVIDQCSFASNTVTDNGGGIFNRNSYPSLTGCVFASNHADSGGGMHNQGSSPEIIDSTFTDNTAVNGGAMRNQASSSPVISDSIFSDNSATQEGGGLANSQSSPQISGCTFVRNEAESGGGVYNGNGSSPAITSCTFEDNYADFGGGLHNYSGSSPNISGCTFPANTAGNGGGGAFNYGGSPVFSNCNFSNNTAADGGGLALSSYFPPLAPYEACSSVITGCIFYANSADTGGAVSNRGALMGITNGVFLNNEAVDGGAIFSFGISADACDATLTNCTFRDNTGTNGNAVFLDSFQHLYPSTAGLANCILWDGVPEICNHDGATIAVTFSDVMVTPGSPVYPGAGNISQTPLFVDPGNGDLRLQGASACIDSGSNAAVEATGVTHDIDGNWRILNNRVDMGSCEFIPLWSPWQYDMNHNHSIDFAEMIDALMDYLIDDISYSQMIDVLMEYLS